MLRTVPKADVQLTNLAKLINDTVKWLIMFISGIENRNVLFVYTEWYLN